MPVHFKNYLIVYSVGKDPDNDDKDADLLFDCLQKASDALGVKFDKPGFLSFPGGI